MKRLGVLALATPANGGTFRYTLSMLEGLRHLRGWKVTIYTGRENSHYDDGPFAVKWIDAGRVRWPHWLASDALRLPVRPVLSGEDAVIAPTYSPCLLALGVPFAFTLHDLQERYLPENFSLAQRMWRRHLYCRIGRRAGTVICESQFVKDDIVKFVGLPTEKIVVIPAPPLPMPSTQGKGAVDVGSKYQLPEQYLFYPAQFWKHKNHFRLVQAFAQISERHVRCRLVVTGRKRYDYARVFAAIDELRLRDRVHHVEFIEQDDLYEVYRRSVALVMPSLFESVSIPIYEAFQAGTTVLASDIAGLSEQVGDAGLLFDPRSIESIADAMRRVLDDAALRARLAAAGRQRLSSHTVESYGYKLQQVIDALPA